MIKMLEQFRWLSVVIFFLLLGIFYVFSYFGSSVSKRADIPDFSTPLSRPLSDSLFSQELIEQMLRNRQLARTYDSMAVELYRQLKNSRNKYTEEERTQLLLESNKLREMSNENYEKYLELAQSPYINELNMFDQKMDWLRLKANWRKYGKATPDVKNDPTKLTFRTIDEIIEQLENANIVFNAPETMKVTETWHVILLMSEALSKDVLTTKLSSYVVDSIKIGKIFTDSARVSKKWKPI